MERFSRRKFLQQAGTGIAAIGAVSAVSGIPAARTALRPLEARDTGAESPSTAPRTEPIVVHIPNPRTGRLHLMFGTEEVVHHDPALVARLVRATR